MLSSRMLVVATPDEVATAYADAQTCSDSRCIVHLSVRSLSWRPHATHGECHDRDFGICTMNPILERDGTGDVVGHGAVAALHSLLRSIGGILDECAGSSPEARVHHGCELAAELLPPVHTLAIELRQEHGDDPSLRLEIMRLEQRMRDHPPPVAPRAVPDEGVATAAEA